MRERYLEDFAAGQIFGSGRLVIDKERIKSFAAEFDPQPFHLSEEGAEGTLFGSLAASGWHTAAMTMAMTVAEQGKADGGSLGAVGIDALRWLKPVRPGDVLRVESEVIEVRASEKRPEMGSVRSRVTVLDQTGAPVMRFEPIVLYRRREG